MDLSTLAMFFMVIASAVGLDTVLHPTSVVLEASVAGKLDKLTIDSDTLTGMLIYEVTQICSTRSILTPPEVRADATKGVGMALAQTVNMGNVALALQAQFGYQPERIKLTLIGEADAIKMLVSGSGMGGRIHTPPFQEQLILRPGETIASFVHRGALLGMKEIDPYGTALYLVQSHADDGDFKEAEELINQTLDQLPQTPIQFDRSTLQNLLGIVALLRGNLDDADHWFHTAVESDPSDAAAQLNATFVDLQLGHFGQAQQHVEDLMRNSPPTDKTLLATASMSWAAALIGLYQYDAADRMLAQAIEYDASSSAAYEVWSDLKRIQGDIAAANELHTKAWEAVDVFQNYAEVAALYFRVPWRTGQQLRRSQFVSTGLIKYNNSTLAKAK